MHVWVLNRSMVVAVGRRIGHTVQSRGVIFLVVNWPVCVVALSELALVVERG